MPNVMVALPNIGGARCSTPTTRCRAVMLPRRETHSNLEGCPKVVNRSQLLLGRSSPYYQDMWRTYFCLTIFFRLSIRALVAKIQPDKVVRWCRDGDFWRHFASCVFSEPRAASFRLHLKFALGPHHVWKYGRHPIYGG